VSSSSASLAALLAQGQQLHDAGHAAQALAYFQRALAMQPDSLDAANAYTALLVETGKIKEAFHLLDFRRAAVLKHADSACNWAIVCEQVGQIELAAQAYETTLHLQTDHLRALNNSALLAASRQDWATATARLSRALALAPENLGIAVNLTDVLSASHQQERALQIITNAAQQLSDLNSRPDVHLRLAVQLAFCAKFDTASTALHQLSDAARQLLPDYLESIGISANRFGWSAKRLPSAEALYQLHAFDALLQCDWKNQPRLVALMRDWIDTSHRLQQAHDWRDLQFFALMLPLSEEQQGHATQDSRRYFVKHAGSQQLPVWREQSDGRIHVAIAAQNLREERQRSLLLSWMKRIDRQRFAMHIFSQTASPAAQEYREIAQLSASFTEIAAMSSTDVVQKIRATGVHIFMDTAYYTPSCRADLPFYGVAPVQLRHQSWQRLNPGTVQFVVSDHFTTPDGYQGSSNHDGATHGPTVRLPYSCWLHSDDTPPETSTPHRGSLGLPEDALVLCCRVGTPMIDPTSFSLWMQILSRLPESVLWLPAFDLSAQTNLRREAELAGISAHRLVFARSATRAQQLAQLRHADLFLDTLLFNANHGLVDALRMGVPALSCAGHNMASRLGGSIICAAGLPELVFDSEVLGVEAARKQYLERAVALGESPGELQQIKQRLGNLQSTAPLFQINQRVAEWQTAWQGMAEQARHGVPLTAFDVPPSL
jgi:protein O-GlcNAc transferase